MVRRNESVVFRRPFTSLRVPLCQVGQFGVQDSGLYGVEPAVITLHIVVVLLNLTVIAQHPHLLGCSGIIRSRGTSLTTRSQILPRIETEGRGLAHRARHYPL